jgi:anti-sigma B factor antagonist
MRVRAIYDAQVISVVGRLDGGTVARVRPMLHEAVDAGAGVLVVDLGGMETIDIAGLGVLVGTHRRALRAGRRLVLRRVPPRVLRVLAVTRLYRVLAVEPRPEEAVDRKSVV